MVTVKTLLRLVQLGEITFGLRRSIPSEQSTAALRFLAMSCPPSAAPPIIHVADTCFAGGMGNELRGLGNGLIQRPGYNAMPLDVAVYSGFLILAFLRWL
jgi:hypothetical protein